MRSCKTTTKRANTREFLIQSNVCSMHETYLSRIVIVKRRETGRKNRRYDPMPWGYMRQRRQGGVTPKNFQKTKRRSRSDTRKNFQVLFLKLFMINKVLFIFGSFVPQVFMEKGLNTGFICMWRTLFVFFVYLFIWRLVLWYCCYFVGFKLNTKRGADTNSNRLSP